MQTYMKRDERKSEVIQTLLGLVCGEKKRLTCHEIARRMGMKASTHLRHILYEMVESGVVVFEVVQHRPHVQKVVFSIPDVSINQKELF